MNVIYTFCKKQFRRNNADSRQESSYESADSRDQNLSLRHQLKKTLENESIACTAEGYGGQGGWTKIQTPGAGNKKEKGGTEE